MAFTVQTEDGQTLPVPGTSYSCNGREVVVVGDASGGGLVVQLPEAPVYPTWKVDVKKGDPSTNPVTVVPPPPVGGVTPTIDSGSSVVISTPNQTVGFRTLGRNYVAV